MTTHRRIADPRFRQQQWDRRYDARVIAINQLVDRLAAEREERIPYVAPHYGGTDAEVLFIFQDPGPGTDESRSGSGFLCCENDDPSAQLLAECFDATGLDPSRVITWNAYPWAMPAGRSSPRVSELEAGLDPLRSLISLLPKLQVVAPMGRVAQDGWSRFAARHPKFASRYTVLPGLHTSGRGITNGGQHTRAEGVGRVQSVMLAALAVIDAESQPQLEVPAKPMKRSAKARSRSSSIGPKTEAERAPQRLEGPYNEVGPVTPASPPEAGSPLREILRRIARVFSNQPTSN